MIALSDAALAHLAIGASRIPVSRRRRWILDVGRLLETGQPPKKTMAASTIPTREWRARLAAGQVMLKITVDEADLGATLLTLGLIDVDRADDCAALGHGVELALSLLGDLSRRDESLAARIRAELLILLRRKVPNAGTLS